ncbi:hypothetical protein GJ496_002011, partial [Pomphorhynchus laevis]
DFQEICDYIIANSTEKLAILDGLINLLESGGDQSADVTFYDGTIKTMCEMLAILYEKIRASIILFDSFKRLSSDHYEQILRSLDKPLYKITRISLHISNALKLRPMLPLEWTVELYNSLHKLCGEVAVRFSSPNQLSTRNWSIFHSEHFFCDVCEVIVNYIRHIEDRSLPDAAYKFVDRCLSQIKEHNSVDTYNLLLNTVINSLVERDLIAEAIEIGKKHRDFESVVEITLNKNLLDELALMCEEFGTELVNVLFEVLHQRCKTGILLDQPLSRCQSVQNEIQKHPDIYWIQLIQTGNYKRAFSTMRDISQRENRHHAKTLQLAVCRLLSTLTNDNKSDEWLNQECFVSHAFSILPQCLKQNIIDSKIQSLIDLVKLLCSNEVPLDRKVICYSTALQATQFIQDSVFLFSIKKTLIRNV